MTPQKQPAHPAGPVVPLQRLRLGQVCFHGRVPVKRVVAGNKRKGANQQTNIFRRPNATQQVPTDILVVDFLGCA